ncbi:hypothetical protein KGM_211422 [Danaus plexippus plexippus]|uniref:Uncharacterized protein n=1 Tax=Danaus plexippus plexippus TaxID=278856 RepID=A0A212EZX1_DANPL|nr:hypothetical protein KGM_211422 [Danaus plexippus plexippus]
MDHDGGAALIAGSGESSLKKRLLLKSRMSDSTVITQSRTSSLDATVLPSLLYRGEPGVSASSVKHTDHNHGQYDECFISNARRLHSTPVSKSKDVAGRAAALAQPRILVRVRRCEGNICEERRVAQNNCHKGAKRPATDLSEETQTASCVLHQTPPLFRPCTYAVTGGDPIKGQICIARSGDSYQALRFIAPVRVSFAGMPQNVLVKTVQLESGEERVFSSLPSILNLNQSMDSNPRGRTNKRHAKP